MITPDPRTVLRDRIATVMHHAVCEFADDESGPERRYVEMADAVMSLFADVRPSPWLRAGYVIADIREESTDG